MDTIWGNFIKKNRFCDVPDMIGDQGEISPILIYTIYP